MSQWWTYSLSDFLMFSNRSYWRLIEHYNAAIWPAHLLALVAGMVVLGSIAAPGQRLRSTAALLLAAAWGWVAWAFHLARYAEINTAAPYFAAAFGLQALLMGWVASSSGPTPTPTQAPPARMQQRLALGVAGLAVFAYPWLALVGGGDRWRQVEVFGIAPDPTVVATLGVLLAWRAHWTLWLIPVGWCLVGGATLMELRIGHAWLLPALALASAGAGWAGRQARRGISSTTNPRS